MLLNKVCSDAQPALKYKTTNMLGLSVLLHKICSCFNIYVMWAIREAASYWCKCTLSPSSSIYIRAVKKGSSTDTFYKPRERIRFSEEVVCSARVQNIFPAYSLRDTIGSKVIFTMGFQPSCHAILRKHTLHSHLI